MTHTERLRLFLTNELVKHPFVRPNFVLDGGEYQIKVDESLGVRRDPKGGLFDDPTGGSFWDSRYPKNADDIPDWTEPRGSYPLELYAEKIGVTGWTQDGSHFGGADVDVKSAGKHEGTGIEKEEAERIIGILSSDPRLDIYHSNGGEGYHLWVHLGQPVTTKNHDEHADLIRYLFQEIGKDHDLDLSPGGGIIDVAGGNLWLWAKNMSADGQQLIRQQTKTMMPPNNWRELIPKKETRQPADYVATAPEEYNENQKFIIRFLGYHGYACNYESFYIKTHRYGLWEAYQELKQQSPWLADFSTNSGSSNPTDPNCWMFPYRGGFRVYTYDGIDTGAGWIKEEGRSYCDFARSLSLHAAADQFGGKKHRNRKGGFMFPDLEAAKRAADAMGVDLAFPENWSDRPFHFYSDSDGLIVEMQPQKGEPAVLKGWTKMSAKSWLRILRKRPKQTAQKIETIDPKSLVRFIKDRDLNGRLGAGRWCIKLRGEFSFESKDNCISKLAANEFGIDPIMAKVLDDIMENYFVIVNKPLQGEYTGKHEWNLNAAQFAVTPKPESPFKFPTILKVFTHLGEGLTEYVKADPWCQTHGCKTGGAFLLWWAASMFQKPSRHLPFLYFYGRQGSGRSTLHHIMHCCLKGGVASIDKVYTRPKDSPFNAELFGLIYGYCDERSMCSNPTENYDKTKAMVTDNYQCVEKKGFDNVTTENTMHLVATSNHELDGFPLVDPDDRRTIAIRVAQIPQADQIGEVKCKRLIQEEIADFLGYCLSLKLPDDEEDAGSGGCYLPVLHTKYKAQLIDYWQEKLTQEPQDRAVFMYAKKLMPLFEYWCQNDSISGTAQEIKTRLDAHYKGDIEMVDIHVNFVGQILVKLSQLWKEEGLPCNIKHLNDHHHPKVYEFGNTGAAIATFYELSQPCDEIDSDEILCN